VGHFKEGSRGECSHKLLNCRMIKNMISRTNYIDTILYQVVRCELHADANHTCPNAANCSPETLPIMVTEQSTICSIKFNR